jgi:hypothetical protein
MILILGILGYDTDRNFGTLQADQTFHATKTSWTLMDLVDGS